MEFQGLDDFKRKINDLQQRLNEIDGLEVSASELMTPDFMRTHSHFQSFSEMCEAVGITSDDEFRAMPDADWDAHVARTTNFASWEAMQDAAVEAWLPERLGLEP